MSLKIARILFFIFLTVFTGALSFVPGHNGDMPYYIAAAFEKQGMSEADALSATKSVLNKELDPEESRAHIYHLDHAEKNILDYYRIKPLYITSINFFHQLGFSYIRSGLIPSLLSFFLLGSLLFTWASKVFNPLAACIFSMILMFMNPCIILARLSSPDPISNLLLFICFYRIYFQKSYALTIILIFISLFVRLDNFVTAIVLLPLMYFWPVKRTPGKMPLPAFFTCLLFSIIIGVWINFHYENNFWWFKRVGYIQSPVAYGHQVMIFCLSVSQSFLPALLLMIVCAWFYRKASFDKKMIFLLTGIAGIFLFRFLLFPSFEERFATAYYLCGFLLVLESLTERPNIENIVLLKGDLKSSYTGEK